MQLELRVPSAAAGVIGKASVIASPAREIHVLTIALLLTIQALRRRAKTKRHRPLFNASSVVISLVARPMPTESVSSWDAVPGGSLTEHQGWTGLPSFIDTSISQARK